MKKKLALCLAALTVLGFTSTATATVSDYIPVGGVLSDLDGDPLDGAYDLTFALYDDEVAATAIWSEAYSALEIEDGLFTVYLGSATALDFDALIAADQLWLGLTVGTDSEMERIPLGTVPFAIEAYQSQFVGDLAEGDIQPMLAGANECAVGTFLRGWDDLAMAPICEADDTGYAIPSRVMPPSTNTTTTLVSTDEVGYNPSITIGTDGLGIIAYENNTSGGVEIAHCEDLTCTTATVTVLAAAGDRPEIVIGSDGLPVVVTESVGSIYFFHCGDAACTSSTQADIQTGDSSYPALTIGADGLPIMGFRWNGGASGSLRTAHCDDLACASFTTNDAIANDYVNASTSAGLGSDGMVHFGYQRWQTGDEDVMVARCNDLECTTANAATITNLDDPRGQEMVIGDDGLPIFVYVYYYGGGTHFVHCDNHICSSVTDSGIGTVWGNTQASQYKHSITIGTNGLPFSTLSGVNAVPNQLLGFHCTDAACTHAGATVIETSGAGGETSVTIGVDGNPLIAYRNSADNDLMVTHCSSPMCTPYFRRR